jgi:hypothetical protein
MSDTDPARIVNRNVATALRLLMGDVHGIVNTKASIRVKTGVDVRFRFNQLILLYMLFAEHCVY